MKDLTKHVVCAAAIALTIAAQSAFADEEFVKETSGGIMMYDLVLARPAGIVGVLLGAVGFVVALPFTIPSGSVGKAQEELIMKPVRYTFTRPLGEIQKSE